MAPKRKAPVQEPDCEPSQELQRVGQKSAQHAMDYLKSLKRVGRPFPLQKYRECKNMVRQARLCEQALFG
eukprot:9381504-Lingulodinium_polyedra.AAC.1